jgi:uncharacterized protein
MKIFVTGASGLVGKRLVRALLQRGDTVLPLSRKPTKPDAFGPGDCQPVQGDPTQPGPWQDKLRTCDAAINLAGESITAKRWNTEFLNLVRSSRVNSTHLVASTLGEAALAEAGPGKVLISTSGVGYYGVDTGKALCPETASAGADVMAQICVAWEAAAEPARHAGVRVVHPRFGIVLDTEGGALPRLALPFKWFVGGRIASGKQYMSWIHHADLTGLLLYALDTATVVGPVNAVAPGVLTNAEFSKALAKQLRRPCLFPAPKFALRLLLGDVADVLAGGQRAVPKETGYQFKYPQLREAMAELYG